MSEPPNLDPVFLHYTEEIREEQRTAGGTSRLEYLRSLDLLSRFLPSPPAVILDVGGAAGTYAFPLADRGYEVHLVDLIPRHIELARAISAHRGEARLASIEIGDARQLQAAGASVDAVLLLGPLYHLTRHGDRLLALGEARRALRADGVVIVAAISRWASTYDGLVSGYLLDPSFRSIVERDVREGQHRNPERRAGWFTTAYFHTPDELRAEMVEAGFDEVRVLAVEGPGGILTDLDAWLDDPGRRSLLLETIERSEEEPSLLGASPHLIGVARIQSSTATTRVAES